MQLWRSLRTEAMSKMRGSGWGSRAREGRAMRNLLGNAPEGMGNGALPSPVPSLPPAATLAHREGTAGNPNPCSTPQLTCVCLLGKLQARANTSICF